MDFILSQRLFLVLWGWLRFNWPYRWRTIQTGRRDLLKDDHDRLIEVKVTVVKGKQFRNFEGGSGFSVIVWLTQARWLFLSFGWLDSELVSFVNHDGFFDNLCALMGYPLFSYAMVSNSKSLIYLIYSNRTVENVKKSRYPDY